MDLDTAILIAMLACASCWYVSFGIIEAKKEIRAREKEEVEFQRRREEIKKLYGR